MNFSFTEVLFALSYALDCVENELVGVTTNHSKRVAYICVKMGEKCKMSTNQLLDLAACALLHDNALTEFIKAEYSEHGGKDIKNLSLHCVIGEKNIEKIKFFGNVKGAILYHHENADGTGPLKKKWKEIPIYARMIHLADQLDANFDLSDVTEKKFIEMKKFLHQNTDAAFDKECAETFINCFDFEAIRQMENDKIDNTLRVNIPKIKYEYTNNEVIDFAQLFATIVDYKSEFTHNHCIGIAQKAYEMGKFYGYDEDTRTKLYLAGALHDIGKLVVDNDLLEKKGKLTQEEYEDVQVHAYETYRMLRGIEGFEEVTSWASLHHEKLNGTGYPFGKTAQQLGKNERLMACLDIYQALVEKRPYKDGMEHQQAIEILRRMAEQNQLDGEIVEDINTAFCNK
ncbi:MAG: HD domain-containing phosphohydrolase [Lachnospiraceae bacterium]|nr:HD domain-containing phosphohydrolase [Lachnospiraceae bacterium]